MLVLATCTPAGSSSRVFWAVGIGLVGLGYLALLVVCARKAAGVRGRLAALFVAAVGLGAFIALFPGGFDDLDANFFARFVAGTALATALGAGVALTAEIRHAWRFLLAGALGGSAFLAWAIGLLLFGLSVGGGCLD
jgi:hypothetical protein